MIDDGAIWFEFVIRLVIGSTLIPTFGLLAILVLRFHSAATRHVVGTLTCLSLLVLPIFAGLLPSWRLGLIENRIAETGGNTAAIKNVVSRIDEHSRDRPRQLFGTKLEKQHSIANESPNLDLSIAVSSMPPVQSAVEPPSDLANPIRVKPMWLVLIVYLCGLAVGLSRIWYSHQSFRRLRTGSIPLAERSILRVAEECKLQLKLDGRIEIRLSDRVAVPLVGGVWSPCILLPESIMQWPLDRVRSAIAHELAHVERRDLMALLLSRFAMVVYWPQPLVTLLSRGMRSDREAACDDRTIACLSSRSQYARHLLDVAVGMDHVSNAASLAMARTPRIEYRIASILSSTRIRTPPGGRLVAWMLVLATLVSIGTAVVSPFSSIGLATALAQETETSDDTRTGGENESEKPIHTISGRVLMPDGTPAAGAVVRTTGKSQAHSVVTTKTDAAGAFALELTAIGLHAPIVIEAKQLLGFVQIPYSARAADVSMTFDGQIITLKPGKNIGIRVLDASLSPVGNASVYIQSRKGVLEHALTNVQGKVNVVYPDGIDLQSIGAVKPLVGCDYRVFESVHRADQTHPNKLPQGFEGDIELVLNGVREASVKIIGPDGQPLAGIRFAPWLIKKPNRGDHWNLPGSLDEFSRETDENGVARFDMLPADQQAGIQFWPRLERDDWFLIANGRVMGSIVMDNGGALVLWEEGDSATVHVGQKVRLTGQVSHSDGQPAANIQISAAGGFRYTDRFTGKTLTDAQGRWEMLVKPNGYYLFIVTDDQFSAEPHSGVLIRDSDATRDLDFCLQPVRRVFGTVNGPTDSRTRIGLQQHAPKYSTLSTAERLPYHQGRDRGVDAQIYITTGVAEDGSYEFKVGPGDFTILSPLHERQDFSITDEVEREFNFALARPVRGPVRVNVVSADNPARPIPNARIAGIGIEAEWGAGRRGRLSGVTGVGGFIHVERELVDMMLLVESADKSLAGLAKLSADEREITLVVAESGRAKELLEDSLPDLHSLRNVLNRFINSQHPPKRRTLER